MLLVLGLIEGQYTQSHTPLGLPGLFRYLPLPLHLAIGNRLSSN